MLGRPRLFQKSVEQLAHIGGLVLFRAFLQLSAQKRQVLFGRQTSLGTRQDPYQCSGDLMLPRRIDVVRPAFLKSFGDPPPVLSLHGRIVGNDPNDHRRQSSGWQSANLLGQHYDDLAAHVAARIGLPKSVMSHDAVRDRGERFVGSEKQRRFCQWLHPAFIDSTCVETVTLAQGLGDGNVQTRRHGVLQRGRTASIFEPLHDKSIRLLLLICAD